MVRTNADLEKMVETSDEWIVERTGIRERRIAEGEDTVTWYRINYLRNEADAVFNDRTLQLRSIVNKEDKQLRLFDYD